MLALAVDAACFTVSFPVRICASIVRRMFPFSTSTQCFACGTNQLRAAARALTVLASRFVALGMLLCAWMARSEPPRKPGIGLPAVWLGITNCAVTALYLFPVQQLNHAGPRIAAVRPCE